MGGGQACIEIDWKEAARPSSPAIEASGLESSFASNNPRFSCAIVRRANIEDSSVTEVF